MTKEAKSVGTSTSWWGLYSIQLAPPFIIKLDPSFNSSVTALARLPIPTTDDQQVPYSVLLETYGTHYVTHVIVGGTAHVYTFVNQAFSNSSTFEEMSTQVGNTGSSWFSQTNDLNRSTSDSFRKNSNSFAVYQPPVVQTVEGKTEYQSWLAYAPQEPVVVNRTLAPLSNLFYRYPQVQAHLQRTIGYYLAKGDLPTLTQLQL
ncbi:unnamed protein product [Rotaria sordida]|uniref:MACPF domain-containing protein n=1 Tax=Rotaria sordida TaxID=392033 RepID=A0A815NU61_9BILA|nr:unnamed protein product [Rotaria sordida]